MSLLLLNHTTAQDYGVIPQLLETHTSGGSKIFPKGMCQLQKSAINFLIFCRKLHENERIWGLVSGAPLDPPMPID